MGEIFQSAQQGQVLQILTGRGNSLGDKGRAEEEDKLPSSHGDGPFLCHFAMGGAGPVQGGESQGDLVA